MTTTARRTAVLLLGVLFLSTTAAPTALAGNTGGSAGTGGFQNGGGNGPKGSSDPPGQAIDAIAYGTRVKITTSGTPSSGGSRIAPVDSNWTPPICWYEPFVTPKQLKAVGSKSDTNKLFPVATYLDWSHSLIRKYYGAKKAGSTGGTTTYKNYNLAKQGKGMFWHGVINPNRKTDYDKADFDKQCTNLIFWVPDGTTPNTTDAISPKKLAEYAYDSIRVPSTKISLNPATKSTVNVPTWVWLKQDRFKPVHVRASIDLPGTGEIWAETTATPTGLHLDPGTSQAAVHPADGTCKVKANGSIGRPYRKSDGNRTPPCGVTYEHASTSGPYDLKATIDWKVTWSGSDGTKDKSLPDGVFGTTKPIEVQEIQSVVNGAS